MSEVDRLVQAFGERVRIPWSGHLSHGERQWFAVYPPEQERRVRYQLPAFRREVEAAGKTWHQIDLSKVFANWMAAHEYRDAYLRRPHLLVGSALEPLQDAIVSRLADVLSATTEDSLTLVVGAGTLFGFVHLSQLFNASKIRFNGRLLLLFPGNHEAATFNLLNARSSYTYQAVAITAAASGGSR